MAYRILSLDGGGTWALLQAMALRDLFPGQNGRAILSNFDLVVANSGGSIALAALMLDRHPDDIVDIFQKRAGQIFVRKNWLDRMVQRVLPIIPKYVAAKKRDGLHAELGPDADLSLSSWGAGPKAIAGPKGAPVKFAIVGFDYDRLRAEFFRSFDPPTGANASSASLLDAIHASSNAPVIYFDAPALCDGLQRRYWDGAMAGFNNPLMAGVVEALNHVTEPIVALSIGTGTKRMAPTEATPPPPPAYAAARDKPGIVSDAAKAAGCINDDPPDTASYTAHVILSARPGNPQGPVVRMNPFLRPEVINGTWAPPPGFPEPDFSLVHKLDMDVTDEPTIQKIVQLGEAWLQDKVRNQPVRTVSDTLEGSPGDAYYSDAKAHWLALIADAPAVTPRKKTG